MTDKAAEARERIDRSNALSLDERVAVLEEILLQDFPDTTLIGLSDKQQKRFTKLLVARGYEPMMFSAAVRLIISRR